MASRPNLTLLLLPAVGLVGLLTFLLWPAGPSSEPATGPESGARLPTQPTVFEPAVRGTTIELAGAEERAVSGPAQPSTVLWPLEVELELLRPADLPAVPSGPPLGSGRNARLSGRIGDERGQGASANVRFVAGPNTGRVLSTDSEGRYGASDLYPGMNVVEIEGPGLYGARREIRTSGSQPSELNLGFGRPGSVSGRVFDPSGNPMAGVQVRVDGHAAETNTDGIFFVARCAPGRVLVEIQHPGFAPMRQVLGVTQNFALPHQRVSYRLERSAGLRVELENLVGPAGETRIFVLPSSVEFDRRFDWSRSGSAVTSGTSVELTDLPPGPAKVVCFRAGAAANPRFQQINLVAGETVSLRVRFEGSPVVRGRVVEDGKLVRGARVRLLAADPPGVFLRHTAIDTLSMESEVYPLLPSMQEEFLTDDQGQFLATSWSDLSPWRLVEALSPDGQKRALAAVGPGMEEIELSLQALSAGPAELVLELPGRRQALPIEIELNGQPGERFELPAERPLEIRGLSAGIWRLEVRWYTQRLLRELEVELDGTVRRSLALPSEAILGQDQETWSKAGRDWPL